MQVFVLSLVLFRTSRLTARPPNQGCKNEGRPNDRNVEPMDHLRSQAPHCITGPPTGPQQIVSLPYLDIHMLPPRQPTDQDYPEILDRRKLTPKECDSRKPGSFLLLVNTTSLCLSGLTGNPTSSHRICTVRSVHCISPDTVFGNFPTGRRQMLSA